MAVCWIPVKISARIHRNATSRKGVDTDYRSFLFRGVAPRYEFGYGLTYSSFNYTSLDVRINATATNTSTISAPVYTNGTTKDNSKNPGIGVGGLSAFFVSVGAIRAW